MPSPTSMPSREHGERGRDTPRVGDGEGEAASTSLASAGGREEPPQPQPDPLDDKLPSSPSKFRPKIFSVHHVDDWGGDGEDRAPSPDPSQPQAKRRREERERATDRARAADFHEKSARRRSPPRERPRPPLSACPSAVSPHAGTACRGFKHPLGSSTPLRCIRRVRRACSSPAGPSIPPQHCRHSVFFFFFFFFSGL